MIFNEIALNKINKLSSKFRIFFLSISLVGFFSFTNTAFATGIDQLQHFVTNVKSARGEFSQQQTKANTQGANASKASDMATGSFVFSRPGKFIWRYQKPYEQLLQADGKKLYVYDKDLNQVTERELGTALGSSPAAILFGSDDLQKNFNLTEGGNKDGMDWVLLKPKSEDTQFQSIKIGFKKEKLEAMQLKDVFGNITLLTFIHFEQNPSLSSSLFQFVIPEGADVLKG